MTQVNQTKLERFIDKVKNYIELLSLSNKNFNELENNTLDKLSSHQKTSLIVSIIMVCLYSFSYYFIAAYGIFRLPFSSYYTYSLTIRNIAIYIAYGFYWVCFTLALIELIREFLFMYTILEKNNKRAQYLLTVDSNSDVNQANEKKEDRMDDIINEDIQKKKREIGDLNIELPYVRYLICIGLISLVFGGMNYFLPFNSRFPSYTEIFLGMGQVPASEYFLFLILMGVIFMSQVFLIVFYIFGSVSRRNKIKAIIYLRVQDEVFQELSKEGIDVIKSTDGTIKIKDEERSTDQVDNEDQRISAKSKSIFNSPINDVKNERIRKIRLRNKIKYLKEREKLLTMIQEEKLKNLYGKKGYKAYKKELKRKKKLLRKQGKKIPEDESSLVEVHGYETTADAKDDEKIKKPDEIIKEKMKKKKKRKPKKRRKYDFT
ncbi:MAG: hypothetical protein GF364_12840 [Candidatus Lokiarchaeota archaeon]|nr:hypothetical protein [Candidatus Lokiarchaeota archaeon]